MDVHTLTVHRSAVGLVAKRTSLYPKPWFVPRIKFTRSSEGVHPVLGGERYTEIFSRGWDSVNNLVSPISSGTYEWDAAGVPSAQSDAVGCSQTQLT